MNHYRFDEITPGMSASFTLTVSEDMQSSFTHMSGDINPLHMDGDYAIGRGYRGIVVYGMCTASLYSTLVGVYLPGEYCLFQECEIAWTKPVYIGDTLTVSGKVTEVDERFKRLKIKASITNQNGEKVSRAKLAVGVEA